MKINNQNYRQLFQPFLVLLLFTFVFGLEKTKLNISNRSVPTANAEMKQVIDIEKIQQLRILKQQEQQLMTKNRVNNAAMQTEFNKQKRGGWLPNKTPSFLKKRPSSIMPIFNRKTSDGIQILFNGSADTTYTIGDTLTITVYFGGGGDSASIGGYLDNGDGVFDETTDIWLFDEGDMWIFDNDDEDENLTLGVFEITFSVDPTGNNEDMMLFLLEGASLFFTATNVGGTATAHLDIAGLDTDYSISGAVMPATTNFIIMAIPSWAMGMEGNDEGPTVFWAAVTDTNGAYTIHVQEQELYYILASDLFGVTEPQLFPEFMQWVDVYDSAHTDVNINLVEANAWITGNVSDQDGVPVSDMIVWAENGPFWVEAITDGSGDYYLGVMAWDNIFDHDGRETMWELNVDEEDLWPDYMIPHGRKVAVYNGDYIDDPDLTNFTLYINDASISGSIEFPADADLDCFGISTFHREMQVFNWIDFCDEDYVSPVSYELPVSSYLDDYGEYWVRFWTEFGEDMLISIPQGHQVSSDTTGIDFELVMANAWFEGQVYSAIEDFPIKRAWVFVHNDSIELSRVTGMDGYFVVPVLGDMWYQVMVYAEGFEPYYLDSVYVSMDDTRWLDVAMEYGGRPHLYAVNDIPHDQGYKVRIQWEAGDPGWWGYFTEFSVWRHVPGSTGGDQDRPPLWDFISMVPWHGYGEYSTVVPTLGNATPFDTTWSVYIVTAHTEDPNFFMDSNPMRGFSVDNLHPSPPLGLQAATGDGNAQVELSWHPVRAPDFDYFTVYRGTTQGFTPDEPYNFTIDTTFIDASVTTGEIYYYVVTAMDFNGNESGYSNETSADLLGTGNETLIPDKYGLAQNYPNPFNPVTTITYDLPQDSRVTLTVYDILGNEIRTLVNDNLPAGQYRQKLNASDMTSGIYFYRIDAGEFRQTRKMMILK